MTSVGVDSVQSFVQGGISPSRATKGLSDRPLETFGAPPDEGVLDWLLEEQFFLCYLLKIVVGVQTEGVQGAIGKPPGCSGKDKPNP